MNRFNDYEKYDALGLAKLVKDREVSARELLAEAKARLEKLNPMLNAVITPMDSLAESLIEKLDDRGPFTGVPFLVKDLVLPFAGFPTANGSVAMKNYIPAEDGDMAKHLNASGLITFAKTTTSELGAFALTNTAAFGETRNPWDLTRNAGGSSGGSSAAVAARIVPMAYSSDGGGSIRLPASYCGIFGFKPSRGLNKIEDLSRAWSGAVVTHASTVSVRDSAAYLDFISGNAERGYSIANPARHTYLSAAMQAPKPLRIAVITQAPTHTPVHAECVSAAWSAAAHCESLGHYVEEADWNFDGIELMRAFLTVVFFHTAMEVGNMAKLLNIPPQKLAIEPNTRFMAMAGSGIGDDQVQQALTVWMRASNKLQDFYRHYDVILTPTAATPPMHSDELDPNALEKLVMRGLVATGLAKKIFSNVFLDSIIAKALYQTPFTPVANISGQPAMSVPLYWSSDGLPHGVQFMAAEGKDRLLFRLAAQLEAEHPWQQKIPPLCR
jgi:amidase